MVVGRSHTTADAAEHAFAWTESSGMIDLGTLGGTSSFAFAVNNQGMVVGGSETADAVTHAFAWTESSGMIDLDTLGGDLSAAYAVNDQGVVAGRRVVRGYSRSIAFRWTESRGMINLRNEIVRRFSSGANAVNAGGMVVGWADARPAKWGTPRIRHAVAWTPEGRMIDLGTRGTHSDALAVNDQGIVVGTTPDSAWHAFAWTESTGMIALGTQDGDIESYAVAVNRSGQVVGWSRVLSGAAHAVLWQVD